MNKQKTVDSKVLAILRECPETRYDDMQLILCYYNRYSYMRVGDLPLEDIVNNYKSTACRALRLSAEQDRECNPYFPNCQGSAVAATAETSEL